LPFSTSTRTWLAGIVVCVGRVDVVVVVVVLVVDVVVVSGAVVVLDLGVDVVGVVVEGGRVGNVARVVVEEVDDVAAPFAGCVAKPPLRA
jgi:hypothetical protein